MIGTEKDRQLIAQLYAPPPTSSTDHMQIKENRLAKEKSPYLLQHAFNPVDWYPWGEEAFEMARKKDIPIFLSVGYSTCHWCHVMARESFSDPEIARILNSDFICIKVDREERPDIDAIYMSACQALTGTGGWPLTIIMTPERKPFFAGTYIPREKRFGMTGLTELLPKISEAWRDKRKEIRESADNVVAALTSSSTSNLGSEPGTDILGKTYAELAIGFDDVHGGFGGSPKFPRPHNLLFLLRYWKRTGDGDALDMVERTLQAMRMGGIYDHLGFGFHRYSVDSEWFVPHFEKMLYDQALISMAYVQAFQATRKEEYAKTAKEILAYVERDMISSDGGFYSAEDADSEGIEGKFYLWTMRDVAALLEEDEAALFFDVYSMMKEGNFVSDVHRTRPGVNILRMLESIPATASRLKMPPEVLAQRMELARRRLFDSREERIHPKKDDKILTDWNGLMISALAAASRAFDESRYAKMAEMAADFILTRMTDIHGRLLHRFRDGDAAIPGNLDDYAFMILGLRELYEATFEPRWLGAAIVLAKDLVEHFWDDESGGFFFIANDSETHFVRQKPTFDGAIPSGNSAALMGLLWLGHVTGDTDFDQKANLLIRAFPEQVRMQPSAHVSLISGLDYAFGPEFEVVISGDPDWDETRAMIRALRIGYLPNATVLLRPPNGGEIEEIAPFLKQFKCVEGKATAYVCTRRSCRLPTSDIPHMLALLDSRGR